MFNLNKALGKLVVCLYTFEARRLKAKALSLAKRAKELERRSNKMSERYVECINGAVKLALKAQQLSKYF